MYEAGKWDSWLASKAEHDTDLCPFRRAVGAGNGREEEQGAGRKRGEYVIRSSGAQRRSWGERGREGSRTEGFIPEPELSGLAPCGFVACRQAAAACLALRHAIASKRA